MKPRSRVVVPALLLAASLVAGCGGESGRTEDAASATSHASEPPVAMSEPSGTTDGGSSATPTFPADDQPDSAEASADAQVTVRDIQIGRHDGFDRVVFEVGGAGTPGWDVRYVDQAVSQGKGDPMDVAGNSVLQVTLTGAGYPYDTGVPEWSGPDPLAAADTRVVTEVVFDGTFEGTTVAFVGTTTRKPFRVYLLEGPARVVVDVADAD